MALSALAEQANQIVADIWATGQEEGPLIAYSTALSDHARACRRELNTARQPQLPPSPQKRDFFIDPELAAELEQQRRDLWHEARAHGMTPREHLSNDPIPPKTDVAPARQQGKPPRPHKSTRPKGPNR